MSNMYKAALLPIGFLVLGCNDTRVSNLEKRVSTLEHTVSQLQADKATAEKVADTDAARQTKLEICVAEANGEFSRDIASNGERQPNGTYNVPVPVANEMQRVKQGKIDECKLLYSK